MVDEPLPTPVVARRQIKIDPILLTLGRWFDRAVERDTPRHADVDDRAEEEEHDELGNPSLHGNILRHIFPSPAAFGTTGGNVTAQVIMLLG